jgi:hypothetical protein
MGFTVVEVFFEGARFLLASEVVVYVRRRGGVIDGRIFGCVVCVHEVGDFSPFARAFVIL